MFAKKLTEPAAVRENRLNWKVGRVVEGASLLRTKSVWIREFESLTFRKLKEGIRIGATELKNSGTQKRHGGI